MLYNLLIIFIIFIQFLLFLAMLFIVSNLVFAIFAVPWVPTRNKIGKKMFELAELKPGEVVVDFGCGDGSLLLTAVADFGAAKGIGYEIHPGIRWLGKIRAFYRGLAKKIDLRGGNFFKAELPPADVVATYLFPETQVRLEPLLKKYYPSGTRVISRAFVYPTLPLEKSIRFENETIHLYRLP
ncbi:MAG: methyltransferase [Candidatus Uhrbacteria bacterium]